MKNKNLLLIFFLALAGFILWFFWHIFIYIIIAAILALIGQPIDRFYTKHIRFKKFTLSSTLSAGLAFLTLLFAFFLVAVFFIPLVTEEAKIISSLDKTTILTSMQKPIDATEKMLRSFNIDFEGINLQAYLQEKLLSFLSLTNLSLFFNRIVGALGDFLLAFFSISFLTFFFLRDEDLIISAIFSFIPENYSEKAKKVWSDSQNLLKRYFIGVSLETLIIITCLSIGLWIAGIRHAMLIALFAGLINVIPYVGPLIGISFALFIGLTTNPALSTLAITTRIILIMGSIHIADASFLQAIIYSSSVKAHPIEIFLVILVGATIGGIGGMILAVPSYTIIRVVAKEFFTRFKPVK